MVAIYDLFAFCLTHKRKVRFNAHLISLAALSVAITTFWIQRLLALLGVVFPQDFDAFSSEKFDARKQDHYVTAFAVMFLLNEYFAVVAALNTSVMWLEIAVNSKHLHRGSDKLQMYHNAVLIFEILFFVVSAVLAGLSEWALAAVVTIPFLVVIAGLFLVGRYKMAAIVNSALAGISDRELPSKRSLKNIFVPQGKKDPNNRYEKTHRTMLAMNRTSFHVTFALCNLIFWCILFAFSGSSRDMPPSPNGTIYFTLVANDMIHWCIFYLLASLLFFVNRAAWKSIRAAKSSQVLVAQNEETSTENPVFEKSSK